VLIDEISLSYARVKMERAMIASEKRSTINMGALQIENNS